MLKEAVWKSENKNTELSKKVSLIVLSHPVHDEKTFIWGHCVFFGVWMCDNVVSSQSLYCFILGQSKQKNVELILLICRTESTDS